MDAVQEAVVQFGNQIQMMPGGGLRSTNALKIKEITQASYYHTSGIVDDSEIANLIEINALKDVISNV
jgi:copper homeostasis protein